MQGVSSPPDTSHGKCHRLSSDEACAGKMPHFAVNFPLAVMELVLQSSPCNLSTGGSQQWGQTMTAPACVCFHRWLTLSGQPAAWCSPRWWWCTPRGTASRVSPSHLSGPGGPEKWECFSSSLSPGGIPGVPDIISVHVITSLNDKCPLQPMTVGFGHPACPSADAPCPAHSSLCSCCSGPLCPPLCGCCPMQPTHEGMKRWKEASACQLRTLITPDSSMTPCPMAGMDDASSCSHLLAVT